MSFDYSLVSLSRGIKPGFKHSTFNQRQDTKSETNKAESKARIVTDDEETTLLEGVSALLSVVRVMGGELRDLPSSWESCTEKEREAVLTRTFSALAAKQNDRDRGILRAAKGFVDSAVSRARAEKLEGYRAIAALVAKTPEVKAILGDKANPPNSAYVPITEVREAFPGLSDDQIVPLLHRMNYKLAKGRNESGIPRIAVTITEEHVKAFLASNSE